MNQNKVLQTAYNLYYRLLLASISLLTILGGLGLCFCFLTEGGL